MNPNSLENLKPFQQGNTIAKGRPVGAISLKTRLKKALEIKTGNLLPDGTPETKADIIIANLLQLGEMADLPAIKEILDRAEGKVPQRIEQETRDAEEFASEKEAKEFLADVFPELKNPEIDTVNNDFPTSEEIE